MFTDQEISLQSHKSNKSKIFLKKDLQLFVFWVSLRNAIGLDVHLYLSYYKNVNKFNFYSKKY